MNYQKGSTITLPRKGMETIISDSGSRTYIPAVLRRQVEEQANYFCG